MAGKRIGIVIGAVGLLALAAIAGYFLQLTAPVSVSQSLPAAPTLAVPAEAAAAATPATAAQAPAGTPGSGGPGNGTPGAGPGGFPPGGFPPGSPPPGGFPPGGPGGPGRLGGPQGQGSTASSTPPAAPTLAPAAGSAQLFRIDAAQSKASYSVSETFLQNFAGMQPGKVTTVGTSKAIAGDILVDRSTPAASHLGTVIVDISQLQSDIGMRDNAIRRQWLESAQYPLATFANAKISGLPASWPAGQAVPVQISGDLTVHGTTQPVTWQGQVTLDGSTLRATATTTVQMTQFGVQAPSLPMLTVEDPAALTLDLVAPAVP